MRSPTCHGRTRVLMHVAFTRALVNYCRTRGTGIGTIELAAPLCDVRELLADLVHEVPGQDEDVVGASLGDPLRRTDRDVRAGREEPCLCGLRSTV